MLHEKTGIQSIENPSLKCKLWYYIQGVVSVSTSTTKPIKKSS